MQSCVLQITITAADYIRCVKGCSQRGQLSISFEAIRSVQVK